jgi:hypothetical protein
MGSLIFKMFMKTTSGSGRIVKRKLTNGDISFTFSVVRNVRINGRPRHVDLAKMGTFRQSEFPARAEEFWSTVDRTLAEMVKTNKLWNNDRLKIENQFSKFIPKPSPAVTKTVEPLASNYETLQKLITEIGEKAERKLAEKHGVNL